MMKAVFYNTPKNLCSIYKTGLMCYDILKRSDQYKLEYREDQTIVNGCDFVIFNHHYTTNNWMDVEKMKSFQCLLFCIVTEVGLYTECPMPLTPKIFDHYLVLDPTIKETETIHPLPRPLPFFHNEIVSRSDVVIGSFGLATCGKNWKALFDTVMKDFSRDGCTIRINLAPSDCVPRSIHDRVVSEVWAAYFSLDKKSNLTFEFTENAFSDQELLEWCSQNSIHVFLYNRDHETGLAAVADVAVAVGKPILVSCHATFRHLHKYTSVFPTIGIREAMEKNRDGVLQMKEDWSREKFLKKFETILLKSKRPVIRYLAGGKLGDFIHSLSVVNEKYRQTGHKGVVYLSNRGDMFSCGLETTYQDTFDIIMLQEYIDSYSIHQKEEYDVDLTAWRGCDYISKSFPYTMNHYYSVEWGKTPWIQNIPFHMEWKDKTVIWTIKCKFPYSIQWSDFIHDRLVFISFFRQDYEDFCSMTNMHPEYYKPQSLMETCIILRSCRRFVGSFSAPLAIAFGLHTPCVIGEFGQFEIFCKDFEKVLPSIIVYNYV